MPSGLVVVDFLSGDVMGMIQNILDSKCAESTAYCSWEEYIRAIGLDNGILHAATDTIYPIMGYDYRSMDDAFVIGFALVPSFQDESKHFCGMFFDYDGVNEFADFVNYVYEFEEIDAWETDVEVILYHNRAAILDIHLQQEAEEFGFTEVVAAAMRGQYEGHSSWVREPPNSEV